jgi:hypothetical protein
MRDRHQTTYFNWKKKYDGLQPPESAAAENLGRRERQASDNAFIEAFNAFIEAFNGRFRAECLNAHWFQTLDDARSKTEDKTRAQVKRFVKICC